MMNTPFSKRTGFFITGRRGSEGFYTDPYNDVGQSTMADGGVE